MKEKDIFESIKDIESIETQLLEWVRERQEEGHVPGEILTGLGSIGAALARIIDETDGKDVLEFWTEVYKARLRMGEGPFKFDTTRSDKLIIGEYEIPYPKEWVSRFRESGP